jgi:L-ribulokinase
MAASGGKYSLGIDYGTNSVRALVVDAATGEEIATAVCDYPSGESGVLLDRADPLLARQNPLDYVHGFRECAHEALRAAGRVAGFSADRVAGIGVDATGSTPIPVDQKCRPLSMHPEFKNELPAMAWLWKDHTAHAEAEEITEKARASRAPYLAKCGGAYSSEWYWSKILHCERHFPRTAAAAHTWLEQSDFVPALLTGQTSSEHVVRNICAAGHKAMYHPAWGGLPSEAFLESLEPGLSRHRRRFAQPAQAADRKAGGLTAELAAEVKLPAGVPVAVGAIDAHLGAVGAGCTPGTLVKIMGTSTCDCMVWPLDAELPDIPGVCGIAVESIVPGMFGIEAGQSAVGDLFNWFVQRIAPDGLRGPEGHARLSAEAARLRPGESGLLALDWHNGNRNILTDPLLTGLIVGESLATTPAEIYRALIEATAFGARRIIERIEEYGVKIERVVACGGIAEKSPLVMQIYADVCKRPMFVSRSSQTCALGAAICGAVVGGGHSSITEAQRAMTGVKRESYAPDAGRAQVYERLYGIYKRLHDAFGVAGSASDVSGVMKELVAIRDSARVRH